MFADDTKFWCRITKDTDSVTLQHDIDSLSTWSNTWQLKSNAVKCKVMHIGHSLEIEYYTTDGSTKKKLECVHTCVSKS